MKQQSAVVQSIDWLTPTILRLRLRRKNRQPFFRWRPGQYASLNFPDYQRLNGYRPFSIASSPTQATILEFGIRVHGPYTNTLRNLVPGDQATVQGAFGSFTTRGIRHRPMVMVAGGIGVTPFMSMIRTAADLSLTVPMTLIFSNRTIQEIPYHQELLDLERRNKNFHVMFAVTGEGVPNHDRHYLAGKITDQMFVDSVGDALWTSTFFLCGPAPFMNSMEQTLWSMGVDQRAIRSESFSVKPGALFEPRSPWPKVVFAAWGATAAIALGVIASQPKKITFSPSNQTTSPAPSTPSANASTNPSTTSSPLISADATAPVTTNPTTSTLTPTPAAVQPTAPSVPQYYYPPRATQS